MIQNIINPLSKWQKWEEFGVRTQSYELPKAGMLAIYQYYLSTLLEAINFFYQHYLYTYLSTLLETASFISVVYLFIYLLD